MVSLDRQYTGTNTQITPTTQGDYVDSSSYADDVYIITNTQSLDLEYDYYEILDRPEYDEQFGRVILPKPIHVRSAKERDYG